MPRPVSWLPRLHEIRRTVDGSVRSHYDRSDLEKLFKLQPRAAGKLLEMLPTVAIGRSMLIEREVLRQFLERVTDADDITGLFDEVRAEKENVSRRKARALVRRDYDSVSMASLPDRIKLSRGILLVNFATADQLAESLFMLARVFEDDFMEFVRRYEPEKVVKTDNPAIEVGQLFRELERMEAAR